MATRAEYSKMLSGGRDDTEEYIFPFCFLRSLFYLFIFLDFYFTVVIHGIHFVFSIPDDRSIYILRNATKYRRALRRQYTLTG
jgi:hypothetical protein